MATNSTTDNVGAVISTIASLLPYVNTVAALAPAITTIIGFVGDSINNFHRAGEMTATERDAFLKKLNDLKKDPAWQTDTERGTH